jgi:hypothetical protein
MSQYLRHERVRLNTSALSKMLLTIIAQLRKPAGIIMLIHVRKASEYFRRTRLEYGLVIWSRIASEELRVAIAYNISTAAKQ